MTKKFKLGLFACIAAIPVAAYAATTVAPGDGQAINTGASITSQTLSNGQIRSTHIVPASLGKVSGPREASLDPRAESYFSRTVPRNSPTTATFQATYQIVTARKTTIAQTLLTDLQATGSGRIYPGVFVTVTKIKDSRGRDIVQFFSDTPERDNAGLAPFLTLVGTTFDLKIQSNGNSGTVFVNGVRQYSQSFANNERTQFRYGAYHHAAGEATNPGANIVVTNARVTFP